MIVVCVALVGVGCASSEGGSAEEAEEEEHTAPTLDPEEISRSIPAHLEVEVDGALSFTYDEEVPLRVVVINDPDVTPIRFLSVGLEELKPLGEGVSFRLAFDLAGLYDGPGRYELPAAGGGPPPERLDPESPDPNAAAEGISNVYLTYLERESGDEAGEGTPGPDSIKRANQFENVAEPCTVEVGPEERTGSLECPEVVGAGGETVSIRMEWRLQE